MFVRLLDYRGGGRDSLGDAWDREDGARRKLGRAFLKANLGGIRDTSLDLADAVLECSEGTSWELSPASALLLANTLDYADETARAVEVLQAAAQTQPLENQNIEAILQSLEDKNREEQKNLRKAKGPPKIREGKWW